MQMRAVIDQLNDVYYTALALEHDVPGELSRVGGEVLIVTYPGCENLIIRSASTDLVEIGVNAKFGRILLGDDGAKIATHLGRQSPDREALSAKSFIAALDQWRRTA